MPAVTKSARKPAGAKPSKKPVAAKPSKKPAGAKAASSKGSSTKSGKASKTAAGGGGFSPYIPAWMTRRREEREPPTPAKLPEDIQELYNTILTVMQYGNIYLARPVRESSLETVQDIKKTITEEILDVKEGIENILCLMYGDGNIEDRLNYVLNDRGRRTKADGQRRTEIEGLSDRKEIENSTLNIRRMYYGVNTIKEELR